MDYPLKTIHYNDDYASFRIPENWVEEVEKEGRLHFYDETSDDVFSLRFSLLTVQGPGDLTNATIEDFMKACGIPDYAEKTRIDSNNMIAAHNAREDYEEEDEHYLVHFWEYIHKKSNGQFDLAMFTWSMDAALENNSTYDHFIRLIGEEAKNMKFRD